MSVRFRLYYDRAQLCAIVRGALPLGLGLIGLVTAGATLGALLAGLAGPKR